MYGLEYHRRKQNMSRPILAERSGVCTQLIMGLEHEMMPGTAARVYISLADALGISLKELRAEMPDEDISIRRKSRTENPKNPLTVYRHSKGLTQLQLAERWGATTCECGRLACARSAPLTKHVKALAAYEKITDEEFIKKYSSKAEN